MSIVTVHNRTLFKGEGDDRASKTRVDLAVEAESAAEKTKREVYQHVNLREGYRCRVCNRRCDPDATSLLDKGHHHHVVYASAQGPMTIENICLICARCHDAEHVKRTLSIEGNAETGLTFYRKSPETGQFYMWRREIAPRVFERD